MLVKVSPTGQLTSVVGDESAGSLLPIPLILCISDSLLNVFVDSLGVSKYVWAEADCAPRLSHDRDPAIAFNTLNFLPPYESSAQQPSPGNSSSVHDDGEVTEHREDCTCSGDYDDYHHKSRSGSIRAPSTGEPKPKGITQGHRYNGDAKYKQSP